MRQHRIADHMSDTGADIKLAARYAYAGGRFELYKIGRIAGRIYSYDINSAYPFAISQLPSLTDGTWHHVVGPEKVARFGVYKVRIRRPGLFERQPSPLFHRDAHHNISFPWHVEGWYWSPEAGLAKRYGAEIVEGWELETSSRVLPFSWIPEMYATRKDWKARGISAQLALKLCMNSMYGKLAQRLGWTEATQRIPPFHQLEWAGWVTSYTRTMLYMLMAHIPFDKLIAVETDGIFTTMSPTELGVTASEELGGWEIKAYDEILYVQSGLAWMRSENRWTDKRRGLDPCRKGHAARECDCTGTFSLGACEEYLRGLHPRPTGDNPWVSYVGETTRFVGIGQALASSLPLAFRHCVWETVPREIAAGTAGKRVHAWRYCDACEHKLTAYEQAHDLVIRSTSAMNPMSFPHSIPWEKEEGQDRKSVV